MFGLLAFGAIPWSPLAGGTSPPALGPDRLRDDPRADPDKRHVQ